VKSSMRVLLVLSLCFAGVSSAVLLPSEAVARPPQDEADIEAALSAYCQALSQPDASAVQACSTPPFWGNLQPRLAGGQPLGAFECVGGATLLKPGLGVGQVLWTQPGGVKEVVTLTVVKQGPKWLVSGGPVP